MSTGRGVRVPDRWTTSCGGQTDGCTRWCLRPPRAERVMDSLKRRAETFPGSPSRLAVEMPRRGPRPWFVPGDQEVRRISPWPPGPISEHVPLLRARMLATAMSLVPRRGALEVVVGTEQADQVLGRRIGHEVTRSPIRRTALGAAIVALGDVDSHLRVVR